MDDPFQTNPIPSSLEDDHAQVLGMLNSANMQKRLEDAREKRGRILAARAADARAAPSTAVQAVFASSDKTDAPKPGALLLTIIADKTAATRPAEPASMPAITRPEDWANRPAVPLSTQKANKTPPVLRAPPRLVDSEQKCNAQRLGRTPAHRWKIQTSEMVLGLVLGIFAGVGATWVIGASQRGASDTTATASVASEAAAKRIPAIDAHLPRSDPFNAVPASSSRLIVPKVHLTKRAGDFVLPDRMAAGPDTARPALSGSVDGQKQPQEYQRVWSLPDTAVELPSRIDITEILRAINQPRQTAVPERSVQTPARPATTGEPPISPVSQPRQATVKDQSAQASARPAKSAALPLPPGIVIGDPTTHRVAATPDVAAVTSGARLRTVVHIPPAFPKDVLASIRGALSAAGAKLADTRTVGVSVARNQVRYFNAQDAADAARIAQAIGTEARDFTTYHPSPSVGTLEVWLAD